MNNKMEAVITNSKDILSGITVFKDSRVPVSILFDYLEGGDSLQDFLDNYPSVKREYALVVLELSKDYITNKQADDNSAA